MRFWLSWEETAADYRPMRFPPNEAILAWWCSGEAADGSYRTIVALVEALDEGLAKVVVLKDWPTRSKRVWRFINEVGVDWRPSDRFPLDGWAAKRVAGQRVPAGPTTAELKRKAVTP